MRDRFLKLCQSIALDNSAIEAGWERWESKDMVEFAYYDVGELAKEFVLTVSNEMLLEGVDAEYIGDFLAEIPPMDDLDFHMAMKTFDTPKSISFRIAIVENP